MALPVCTANGWPPGRNADGEGGTSVPEYHALPLLCSSIESAEALEGVSNFECGDKTDLSQLFHIQVLLQGLSMALTLPTCHELLVGNAEDERFVSILRTLPFLQCRHKKRLWVEKLIMQEILQAPDRTQIDAVLRNTDEDDSDSREF